MQPIYEPRYNTSGQPCKYRLRLYFITGQPKDHVQTYYAHLKASHREEYQYLQKLLLEYSTGKRKYKVGGKNATFKCGMIYDVIENTEVKRINRHDVEQMREEKAKQKPAVKLPYPDEPNEEAIKHLPQQVRQEAWKHWRENGWKPYKNYTPGNGETRTWRKEIKP